MPYHPQITNFILGEGPPGYGKLPCGSTDAELYTIVANDTLSSIAKTFKSGACNIASYNNITNPDLIQPGQKIIVPAQCSTTPDDTSCIKAVVAAPTNDTCVKGVSANPPAYFVIPNDTLLLIANNFGITLDALEGANTQITDPNSISVGEQINVPVCQGCSCTNTKHTVVQGDTFSDLATKAGVNLGQIEAANPNQVPEALQSGQVINVPSCQCNA